MPRNTTIILIRHAEKPGEKERGNKDLSEAGQARAWAYVAYFQNFKVNSKPLRFNYLFATAETANSNRSFLTLRPLAQQLNLVIDNRFGNLDRDIEALAKYLLTTPKFDNASILISWKREQVLNLARQLGGDKDILPKSWPEDDFGTVVRISFDASGNPFETEVTRQLLMYSDYRD